VPERWRIPHADEIGSPDLSIREFVLRTLDNTDAFSARDAIRRQLKKAIRSSERPFN
jgi:hypothetical protein